jgi:hypothetical protein
VLETNTAEKNSSSAVSDWNPQGIPWLLVALKALPDYKLYQRFADGTEGITEMRELIFSDHAGVFTSLRDPAVFEQVSIDPDFRSVSWANELDIAPDASYEDIKRFGIQILR